MFKKQIYRDPNVTGGGGNASATGGSPAPASPASSPVTAATSGNSGEAKKSSFESFRSGLAKVLAKDPETSQPPSDGKETKSAATGIEGEEKDHLEGTEEPVTTAKPEDETATDEELEGDDLKGWTEDELKDLKARGLDSIPFTPETRKLEKSFRDARAEMSRLAASNTNMVTRVTDLEAALHSGDVKALQSMGYDLKVDQRTPDMMIQEIETQFNDVKSAIEPLYKELINDNPEIAQALKRSFDKIASKYNDRAAIIAKEQERQALKEEILQETGVKPATKNAYQKISDQAEKNLTALTQQDPEAGKYFQIVKDLTEKDAPLGALGVNLAKLYGTSKQTAELANKIGKGLYFEREMKNIITGERKKWERDREKRSMTHGGGGLQPSHAESAQSGASTRLGQGMRSMMGRS
jgi:hypothetical protein